MRPSRALHALCQLDSRQALDLLRLLQEALTNVLRHSQARRVVIALHADAGQLHLRLHDDGRGLPAAGADAGSGEAPAGLAPHSRRAHVARLQGMLHLRSDEHRTELQRTFTLPTTEAALPSVS